ncbi:MAG TPA: hypothetical protein DDX39_08850 [Bacteroidales bacterium]|nr:MAG: hypothetical protein A2W98_11970 [Bacteroidetes bacterium GWF2_33_38]OFY74698.1 MAG: hypothetical protein A2265_01530 [Bacteroidetes bacterium RIFOXYA12_FULL_33_9]HBF88735.1 hypothetical protein [Bacteroidales bacterium]
MKIERIIFLLITIILIGVGCKKKQTFQKIKPTLLASCTCGAEKLNADSKRFDCGNNITCSGVDTRTEEKVRSGKYAVRLSNDFPFSMTFQFDDVKQGEYFETSVWYFGENGKSNIIASDLSGKKIYIVENRIAKIENGWRLLKLKFSIPVYENTNSIKIYLYCQSNKPTYFDDMTISRYNIRPRSKKESALYLEYKPEQYELFRSLKEKILEAFVIDNKEKEWVKANLFYENQKYKTKIRFKGDWTDHVSSDKWSFRIKIKDDSWQNLRTFSIQSPVVRDFMHEWVLHKLFTYEDVLTTRYEFIPVYVNNIYTGIYAYEEHFEKQLIENRNRREGPIIKFNENDMFSKSKHEFKSGRNVRLPIIQASEILPFGENKLFADTSMKRQFEIAQNLLNAYRTNALSPEDVFDLDPLAKFYAIISLTKSYHALAWHNQRFYFNPITQKLEIIGYDGGDPHGYSYGWVKPAIFGDFEFLHGIKDANFDENLYNFNLNLFKNKTFLNLYVKYLEKYSNPDFITAFKQSINTDFEKNLNIIQTEYPDYIFNFEKLFTNAQNIKKAIEPYKKTISKNDYIDKFETLKTSSFDVNYDFFYDKLMLKAYKKNIAKDSIKIQIASFISKKIYIIGTEDKQGIIHKFNNEVAISQYKLEPIYCEINCHDGDSLIFYSQSKDKLQKVKIHDWQIPNSNIPFQQLFLTNDIRNIAIFDEKNKVITFKKKTTISKNIIIPSDYSVIITKGSSIDIVNNAVFMTFSPIQIDGTEKEPVTITSSDGTAQGFTILRAKGKSHLTHVVFDGLNTLNYNGWNLTGAVTFYESDVEFGDCTFKNNKCEDALNVIRSTFDMKNCIFNNIFSDAFDSDFSDGIILNSRFEKIANDAIDFSGSNVKIEDCNIVNAGDKGISGGENSKMNISDIIIKGCNIGIASKDKSVLEVNNSTLENCKYGFVLLQKKPEYGDASLNANNIKLNNCAVNHLIESGSDFYIDGEKIIGKEKKLADIFYK